MMIPGAGFVVWVRRAAYISLFSITCSCCFQGQDTNTNRVKLKADNETFRKAAKGLLAILLSVGTWSPDPRQATTEEHSCPTVRIRRYFLGLIFKCQPWVIFDLSGVAPDNGSKYGTEYNAAQREVIHKRMPDLQTLP